MLTEGLIEQQAVGFECGADLRADGPVQKVGYHNNIVLIGLRGLGFHIANLGVNMGVILIDALNGHIGDVPGIHRQVVFMQKLGVGT